MVMTQDVLEKAISNVRASTSSGSILPQEKVELAFKLLGVSSRTLQILSMDRVVYLSFVFLQEALGQEGGQAQDNTELNALRERVKTLSSEKAALQGKLKKLSQSKKG